MKFTEKQLNPWSCDISRGDRQCPFVSFTADGFTCCNWKVGHPMPHEPVRDCSDAELERLQWVLPAYQASASVQSPEGKGVSHDVTNAAVSPKLRTQGTAARPRTSALIVCALLLSLCGSARAADPVFLTKSTVFLIALDASSKTADAYFTHQVMQSRNVPLAVCRPRPGHPDDCLQLWSGAELNPLARPFVHSTAGQVGFFAGSLAADIASAYIANRHHPKLAKAILIFGSGYSVGGAAISAH
jgi:hypothetical protein